MRNFMHLLLALFGALHKGTILSKIVSLVCLSLMISPITYIIDKLAEWHLGNETYFSYVLGAIVIDLFLGMMYHAFWMKDFSVKKLFRGFVVKLTIIVTAGYLFEGLNDLMVQESVLKEYTIMTLRLMIFLFPAGSAFGNMYEMSGKKFPPIRFMTKIREFTEAATVNADD